MENSYRISNGNPVSIPSDPSDLEMRQIREKARRNFYLAESDWSQLADNGLTSAKKDEWKTYRQELRDITKTYQSMDAVGFKWPTEPS